MYEKVMESTNQFVICDVVPVRVNSPKERGHHSIEAVIPKEKVLSVLKHIAEGDGLRKTHRLTGVCKDTQDCGKIDARRGKTC